MKIRKSKDGMHLFNRDTGINLLVDEVDIPEQEWSRAPRFVSFALTNLCDLQCSFCYAPKQSATLKNDQILEWVNELDTNGCLGIGFGGGEPTLYPQFASLCKTVAQSTNLSVSFTTHSHRFTPELRDDLTGAVHFIRVSMDGVRDTYEQIRKRSFTQFLKQLKLVSDVCSFGINYVVNDDTINELDEAAEIVFEAGARELLLLPEQSADGLKESTQNALMKWVALNSDRVRLSISEIGIVEGIPLANPFLHDNNTKAYIHVNAFGEVSRTSFQQADAVAIKKENGILSAIANYEGKLV